MTTRRTSCTSPPRYLSTFTPKSIQLNRSPVTFDPSSTACVIKSAPETPMRSEGSPIGSLRPIRALRRCSKPNPGVNSPGSATSLSPILHTLTITVGDVTRLLTYQRVISGFRCDDEKISLLTLRGGCAPEVLGYADTSGAQVTPATARCE